MSSPLKAVCFTVIAFTACTDTTPLPAPKVVVVRPPVERVDAGKSETVVVVPVLVDAGFDTIGLAHDSPLVDHLARARQLKADGDPRGALTEARRAVFTSPTQVEALELTAQLAHTTGLHTLSAEAWGRMASLDVHNPAPVVQQARQLRLVRDWPGVALAGREAIGRDEASVDGWIMVGLSQLAMNELPGAIASFNKAVELDPANGWAMNNLGFAYLRANENIKAEYMLERAAQKLPTVAYVQNNFGIALERLGRNEEAKAAYQHAMDLSPKYVKARVNSARIAKHFEMEDEPETMSDIPQAHPIPEAGLR